MCKNRSLQFLGRCFWIHSRNSGIICGRAAEHIKHQDLHEWRLTWILSMQWDAQYCILRDSKRIDAQSAVNIDFWAHKTTFAFLKNTERGEMSNIVGLHKNQQNVDASLKFTISLEVINMNFTTVFHCECDFMVQKSVLRCTHYGYKNFTCSHSSIKVKY